MTLEQDRQWFSGESPDSFAAAAKNAVRRAEEELGEIKSEYDVQLQVLAEGPLSGYRVLVSPTG
jgi:flavin-binding protein dodecin